MSKPIKKFKAGAIDASIWENILEKNGKVFKTYSVTIERRYLDNSDKWKSTNSFKVNDLPRVTLVTEKAFDYLTTNNGNGEKDTEVTTADEL